MTLIDKYYVNNMILIILMMVYLCRIFTVLRAY